MPHWCALERSYGLGAGSSRTVAAARDVLAGNRRGWRALLPFTGPAFVASVAYMDPGNFATNIQGGAGFGYRLLWVVVLANLMAMLFQALSAKLGIATGKNLAELSREHTPRPVALAMWIVSEIGAMATDLAEFLGVIIALYLLFHVPMLIGAILTGVVTYAILSLHRYGFRTMETVIGSLVGVIAVCYVVETLLAKPNWSEVLYHSVVPWLGGSSSVLLAVGIVGATVMPHAIYLHSALTQERIVPQESGQVGKIVRFAYIDVVIALTIAGLVNLAMMYMAAAVFHATGHSGVADITTAYRTLTPLLGGLAALVFLISLMASGISSSVVGTMAGQVIMQSFVGFTVPLWLRRVVTMAPAVVVVALGLNVTQTLIVSQVVLSFVLPVPVIALVVLTARRDTMGSMANARWLTALAVLAGGAILLLNALLVLQIRTG
ncbi:MAG: Nramp family divalent metal transporter [Candidatus Eremiobacteraeota bacterium]|nr:Nramp family divalent metal transporter [Candidatus Eremiobacteraeota bacterium]MBV8498361.1 Nramp family divalent metal transporter [Candidatus Eremiobacteraeota bacterium]